MICERLQYITEDKLHRKKNCLYPGCLLPGNFTGNTSIEFPLCILGIKLANFGWQFLTSVNSVFLNLFPGKKSWCFFTNFLYQDTPCLLLNFLGSKPHVSFTIRIHHIYFWISLAQNLMFLHCIRIYFWISLAQNLVFLHKFPPEMASWHPLHLSINAYIGT